MPILTFKVSAAEAREIRAKARAARAASVSAYLRKQALGELPKKTKIVRRIHPISGLPYNAASGPVVTDDQIRAALADFP
ncbi:MAG: hypothetical protein C0502_05025 [Opitutus sp.]|nr:hypothetical protein [Opitutus sp.]